MHKMETKYQHILQYIEPQSEKKTNQNVWDLEREKYKNWIPFHYDAFVQFSNTLESVLELLFHSC